MTFYVPGPPVPKPRPRKGKYNNVYQPDTGYEDTVAWEALLARRVPFNADFRGKVKVTMALRVKGRGDADNYAKAILDSCNKILWRDDSQVVEQHVTLERARPYGATVTVEAL